MGALILIRHTTPDVAAGICYGRTDLDLADSFEAEAREALAQAPRPDRIVSSPLLRCRRLAHAAAEKFELDVTIDERLIEMDFGRWEGQAWKDLPRDELDAWSEDFFHARPHGGECVCDMLTRATKAFDQYSGEGRTLAVTHAGILKVAAHLQNQPDAWQQSVPFGGILHHE